jgi:hypothetical protein
VDLVAVSDVSGGPGWWRASDGRWYPPDQRPGPPVPPRRAATAPGNPPNPRDAQPGRGTPVDRRPYWWAGPGSVPTTSGLAIASLVLSILWIGGLGSLLAVIFGAIALSKINRSGGWVRGRGLAGAGLTIGVVGLLGTVALVAGLIAVATRLSGSTLRLNETAILRSPAADGIQQATVESFSESSPVTTPVSGGPASPPSGKTFATVTVRVCTGASASQTGPDLTWFELAFSQGGTAGPSFARAAHPLATVDSLPARTCVTGSITYEIVSGTRPATVEWDPFTFGLPYRWTIPHRA